MKLLVPLNSTEPIAHFIAAGAEEFYLGFQDDSWIAEFGEHSDLNRMSGFGKYANAFTFEEAQFAIKSLKAYGASAFVTFNANCYTTKQVKFMEENYFDRLADIGVDGLIISDQVVARSALKHGLTVVASTMCAIYNTDIAAYWRDVGVRRMILPRDVSLGAIEAIATSFPDVDFEVFFMRNGCVFADCYCLGVHHPGCGATCAFLRRAAKNGRSTYSSFEDRTAFGWNNELYDKAFHRESCALCATWRLLQMGIKALKIVGRADDWKSVCGDIALAKRELIIASSCETEAEYLDKMEFPANVESRCAAGLCCYYPEVRY